MDLEDGLASYRDATQLLLARRDQLLRAHTAELAGLAAVYGRRMGRIAGGVVGALGGLIMFTAALAAIGHGVLGEPHVIVSPTAILLATLLAVPVTVVLGRCSRWSFGSEQTFSHRDVVADIQLLEAKTRIQTLVRRVASLTRASVAAPLIAAALLAPLAMHLAVVAVVLAIPGDGAGSLVKSFDGWIVFAAPLTIAAHVRLVVECWRFSATPSVDPFDRGLRAIATTSLAGASGTVLCLVILGVFERPSWRDLGGDMLGGVAAIAFIVAMLVALTGLFVPALFCRFRTVVDRERDRGHPC